MRRRALALTAGLLVLMSLFGFAVYRGLGHFRRLDAASDVTPSNPITTKAALTLPGTIYLSQRGDLFALHGADFRTVLTHDQGGDYTQPAALPDGSLLVVDRHEASTALVHATADGGTVAVLLDGSAAKRSDSSLEDNHWIFHPRVAPDGTVFISYDQPKQGYLVDLAVWALPGLLTGPSPPSPPPAAGSPRPGQRQALPASARRWSTPNDYTGGDVEPLPLTAGGVIFTRYSIDTAAKIHAQLWYAGTARDGGHALTDAAQDCGSAALSPDGTQVAMVCTRGDQLARIVVAPLLATGAVPSPTGTTPPRSPAATAGPSLGPVRVLVDGTLAAQPVWAPDGSGLAYLAPAEAGGNFQLWWLPGAATSSPQSPQQVTTSLGFDATSRPLWVSS